MIFFMMRYWLYVLWIVIRIFGDRLIMCSFWRELNVLYILKLNVFFKYMVVYRDFGILKIFIKNGKFIMIYIIIIFIMFIILLRIYNYVL